MSSHAAEIAIAVVSIAMFVGTIVAIPIFLVRIPEDYFSRPAPKRSLPVRIARTVAGVVLIALGLAMLVLPGQGLLTVLVGLSILDLPIKTRIIRKILTNEKVRGAIDGIRRKRGKAPLIPPADDAPVPRYA